MQMFLAEVAPMESIVKTIGTSATSNIMLILPIAGGIFALMFGIKFIPKIIKKFQ